MIWLIYKDFLIRRWWAFAGAFVVTLLLPNMIWMGVLLGTTWLVASEKKARSCDVLLTLPIHHRTLGRACWFTFIVMIPAIVSIACAINIRVGGMIWPNSFLVDADRLFMQTVLLMGMLACWLVTVADSRTRLQYVMGCVLLVVGFMLFLSDQPAHNMIGLTLSGIFIVVSFINAPRLVYLFSSRTPRLGVWPQAQQKTTVFIGGTHWRVLREAWVGPLRHIMSSVVGVPLLLTIPIWFARSNGDGFSWDLENTAGGLPGAVTIVVMCAMYASFHWLEALRALRMLPLPRRRLTWLLLSFPIGSSVSVLFVAIPILSLVGWEAFGTLVAGWAYVLVVLLVGCLIYVRWGLIAARVLTVIAIITLFLLPMFSVLRNETWDLQVNPWLALVVLVVTFALGIPYMDRLLLRRSYR